MKSSSTSLATWLHGQYIDRTFSQIVFTAARHTTCIPRPSSVLSRWLWPACIVPLPLLLLRLRKTSRLTSASSPRLVPAYGQTYTSTAQTVIDAYNACDIDAILAYRTPDCQHQVLPSSMARAAQTNGEYRRYLSTIMPMFSNFTVAPPLSMVPCRVTEVGIGRGSQGDT